jgi:predicted secreted hydrolase
LTARVAPARARRRARRSLLGGRGRLRGLLPGLLVFLLAACSGPVLANPPAARPSAAPRTPTPAAPADPRAVVLPRDDGPHDRLTEWWYYTGHLAAADGRTFGFEYVVFRAERGGFPVSWASHLAVTDEAGQRFAYGQRSEIGPQVDHSPRDSNGAPGGFALALAGVDPARPATLANATWTMTGSGGRDTLSAVVGPAEAAATTMPNGFGLQLDLAPLAQPALHGRNGWVDFGGAGGSYYYSRTRMTTAGTLVVDGERLAVTGTAWFDHQWGDFIAVGGGGWDWFAVNLADGTDLTVSLVRSADGTYPLVYGTLVRPDGTSVPLARDEISVVALGDWTSARTGARYPSGWHVRVAADALDLTVVPTVRDQELDTRATTGVVYWEGSETVRGIRAGRAVTGRGYVELTGYANGLPTTP